MHANLSSCPYTTAHNFQSPSKHANSIIAGVQPMVNTERSVYYREHAAGYYSVFPFYFAMVSPPFLAFFPVARSR